MASIGHPLLGDPVYGGRQGAPRAVEKAELSAAGAARRGARLHPSGNESKLVLQKRAPPDMQELFGGAWRIGNHWQGSESSGPAQQGERRHHGRQKRPGDDPRAGGEAGLNRYLAEIKKFPILSPGGGIYARQALERASGHRGRGAAGQHAPAPRRQDRHGLSRLRPAGQRAHLRGQYRPDAGREEVRARTRLPPRHLCDVVDPRLDPGIHPAHLEPGQDGHHRGAEEAVLQPSPDEEPHRGVRGRRPEARGRHQDRHRPRRQRGRRRLDEPAHGDGRRHLAQRVAAATRQRRPVAGFPRRQRAAPGRARRRRPGEPRSATTC